MVSGSTTLLRAFSSISFFFLFLFGRVSQVPTKHDPNAMVSQGQNGTTMKGAPRAGSICIHGAFTAKPTKSPNTYGGFRVSSLTAAEAQQQRQHSEKRGGGRVTSGPFSQLFYFPFLSFEGSCSRWRHLGLIFLDLFFPAGAGLFMRYTSFWKPRLMESNPLHPLGGSTVAALRVEALCGLGQGSALLSPRALRLMFSTFCVWFLVIFCTGGSVAQVVVNFAWANYGEAVLTSMYGVICAEFFELLLVGGLNHIVCELLLCLDCCGNVWVVAYSWRQGPFLFNQLLEWLVCLALVPSSWWSGCCVAVRSAWVLVCSVCYRDHSIAVLCECLVQGLYELLFLSDASMCVFRMPCGSATSCPSPPACSGCSRRPSPVGRRHVVGASCLAQTRCQEVSVLGCFLNRGLPSRGLSMLAATICYGDVIVCAYY